jgi:hypothetical protein
MDQVVEYLPNKCEALSLHPSTTIKKISWVRDNGYLIFKPPVKHIQLHFKISKVI